MRVRQVVIKVPLAGNVRSSAFQSQEPYSCALSTNVLGMDLKTMRKRIATRPRLVTYSSGFSGIVRGIYQVNIATNQTLTRGLFAISAGSLYRYTGTFSSVGIGFGTTQYISGCAYLTDLYIADGTNFSVYECASNTLLIGDNSGAGGHTDPPDDLGGNPVTADPPTNCRIVCEWGGRLVLSGDTTTPHAVYMSRVGSPLDFDYAQTDVAAAVNFTTLDGGLIGEKVTALISHNRECLIIGATDSLHIIRGDPLDGGRLEIISHVVGPLGPSAWCKTADDSTVIATRNGLYVIAPGCGSAPVPLSRERIPDALVGIDSSTYEVHLAFDTRFNALHIYKTAKAGSTGEGWWMDWATGAFWPITLTTSEQPTAMLRFDPLDSEDISGVLLGGTNGGAYRFSRTDASAMSTVPSIYFGPIKLSSSPMENGIIQKMQCVFGSNTTDTSGTIDVFCAESGEAALAAAQANTLYRRYSMTIADQNNNLIAYPRVGGHAAVIKFTQGSTTTYSTLEEITLTIAEAGVMR